MNNLTFVRLITRGEFGDGLITRSPLLDHWVVCFHQLLNPFLERLEIFRCQLTLVIDIVIETMLNHRPNGHFNPREQLLTCVTDQVCKGVTNHFQTFGVFRGDEGDIRIAIDDVRGVFKLTIDSPTDCRLGQSRPNRLRNIN